MLSHKHNSECPALNNSWGGVAILWQLMSAYWSLLIFHQSLTPCYQKSLHTSGSLPFFKGLCLTSLVLLVAVLSSVVDNIIFPTAECVLICPVLMFLMLEQSLPPVQTKRFVKNLNLRLGGNQTQNHFSQIYFPFVSSLNLPLLLGCNQDILLLRQYHVTTFHKLLRSWLFFSPKKYLESRIEKVSWQWALFFFTTFNGVWIRF